MHNVSHRQLTLGALRFVYIIAMMTIRLVAYISTNLIYMLENNDLGI